MRERGVRNVFLLGRTRGPDIRALFPPEIHASCPETLYFSPGYKSFAVLEVDPSLARIRPEDLPFLSLFLSVLLVLSLIIAASRVFESSRRRIEILAVRSTRN